MQDMGMVCGSENWAKPIIVGYDTVYVHTDIKQQMDEEGNPTGLYEYHEVQYPKDEYIQLIADSNVDLVHQLTDAQMALTEQFELNLLLDAQLTDTQLALTEIYENMGVM